MNFNLPKIPNRAEKPRNYGLTMMMDKGLSIREAENFCETSAEYTDLVKFGFGTGLLVKNIEEKIKIYKSAGIKPYFGGTLFEAFVIRNMFDDYCKFITKYNMELTEVSDGSMEMNNKDKLVFIEKLSKLVTVISEVGSKKADVEIPTDKWIKMMKDELSAGSWKVIAEARESGNVGIYNKNGSANNEMIDQIMKEVKPEDIIWEAPIKSQQVYFIKLIGPNVNLGNIDTREVIPLETLRRGLRGDTFADFL
ncbi:MAG: phosphosulfolactate synthase [Bacteroidales bacterium]|nr:phosphosulfolactate synthase [Bacteroidales bacterium]